MLGYTYIDDENYYEKQIIHNNIVNNIATLIKELSLNNIHETFYVFCYLLWNGYFSIGKTYMYSAELPPDEKNTIFLGSGCCRHNADLLSEVNKKMTICSNTISINLIKSKLKNIMNIDTPISDDADEEEEELFNLYNHKVCIGPLYKENSSVFLFDPTQLTECEILKNGKLVCFNGTYKIDNQLFAKDLNYAHIFDYEYNKKKTLNRSQLKQFYKVAREVCVNNEKLFKDFYDENHKNYEKIKSLILEK